MLSGENLETILDNEKKNRLIETGEGLPCGTEGGLLLTRSISTCGLLAELLPCTRQRQAQEAGAQKEQRTGLGNRVDRLSGKNYIIKVAV